MKEEEWIFQQRKQVHELQKRLDALEKAFKVYKEENYDRWDKRFKILYSKMIMNNKDHNGKN